jgi:5-methylcytosine-specific restriction protein A
MFRFFNNFGRSSQWKRVRANHLIKFPYCAACGRQDDLEVHHIIPYQVDASKELDPDNLITLCGKYCHFIFGHLMDWKSWNPNILEDSKNYIMAKENKPQLIKDFQNNEKFNFTTMFNFISNFLCWNNRSK